MEATVLDYGREDLSSRTTYRRKLVGYDDSNAMTIYVLRWTKPVSVQRTGKIYWEKVKLVDASFCKPKI